jgi:hypothetical protein
VISYEEIMEKLDNDHFRPKKLFDYDLEKFIKGNYEEEKSKIKDLTK